MVEFWKLAGLSYRPQDINNAQFWDAFENLRINKMTISNGTIFAHNVGVSNWWRFRYKSKLIKNISFSVGRSALTLTHSSNERLNVYINTWEHQNFSKELVLIKLCHLIQDENTAFHGPEYILILLSAFTEFISPEKSEEFQELLIERKCITYFDLLTQEDQQKALLEAPAKLETWTNKLRKNNDFS